MDAFVSIDAFMYTLLCFGIDAFMYTLLWSDAFIDPIHNIDDLVDELLIKYYLKFTP